MKRMAIIGPVRENINKSFGSTIALNLSLFLEVRAFVSATIPSVMKSRVKGSDTKAAPIKDEICKKEQLSSTTGSSTTVINGIQQKTFPRRAIKNRCTPQSQL